MNRKAFLTIPVLLALIVVLTATSVLAQVTPAGTQIRNRSSATYEDMTGNGYSATSNEVITIVLPVFGVSILPDDSGETPPVTPAMSQNALPGMTLYYRYDLTNTGNDDDDFSLVPIIDVANNTLGLALGDITIYRDLNSNGIVDLGEPVISLCYKQDRRRPADSHHRGSSRATVGRQATTSSPPRPTGARS